MAFASTIDTIRRQWQQIQQPVPPEAAIPVSNPMSGLFDRIAEDLITDREGRIAAIARNYDPALDLAHNLPRRTAGQRHFVENVWKPLVRPHLVAAGFWRVQTIE
jgi:hypothetical protein